MTLTSQDLELIERATALIKQKYVYKKHHVASAVRTTTGKIFVGLHLKASAGRATICAEPAAMSAAFTEEDSEIETIVAVKHPNPDDPRTEPYVVSPCGVCRELIVSYSPHTLVIHPGTTEITKSTITTLLPHPFHS